MKNISEYNLKENPFEHITANIEYDTQELEPWSGLPALKEKINIIYEDIINYKPRQVVLNWGPYGGGKTFTAYHFLQYESKEFHIHQAYIRSPKQGGRSGIEFYKSILNYISYRKIREQIQHLISLMDEDDFLTFLSSRIKSEELADAILLIGSNDESVSKIMRRYVYEGLTKTELKNLGLSTNIDWGTDSIKFLSGIIHCFIGDQVNYKGKFVLWIDEMEDMIYYSQKEYRVFSQILRDLMDSLNQHFCLFMNFTLAESAESTIGVLLGEALWSRITKKIRFKELDIEDAMLYCKEAIAHKQIKPTRDFDPFTEEILEEIIDIIPSENITPREINRYCGGVLKFAQRNNLEEISLDGVHSYFAELDNEE
jgi:hypothetical protein